MAPPTFIPSKRHADSTKGDYLISSASPVVATKSAAPSLPVGAPPQTALPFSVSDIRKAIPAHLFERSAAAGFSHLARDILVVTALFCINVWIQQYSSLPLWLKVACWPVYWYTAGVYATGIWVIAHECGHQSFSSSKALNDAVGLVLVRGCDAGRRAGGACVWVELCVRRSIEGYPCLQHTDSCARGVIVVSSFIPLQYCMPPELMLTRALPACCDVFVACCSTRRCWCRTTRGPSRTRTTTPTRAAWRTTRCLCPTRARASAWWSPWRRRRWRTRWAYSSCSLLGGE